MEWLKDYEFATQIPRTLTGRTQTTDVFGVPPTAAVEQPYDVPIAYAVHHELSSVDRLKQIAIF
jgi:hypothetical protein